MPQMWTIRAWRSATNSFVAEKEAQTADVQAAFDQRLRFLSQSPPNLWRVPQTKQLDGEGDGLVEIRFKADGVQQRPLGFYGPGRMEFTLLSWATEKGDKFVPKDALKIAQERKKQIDGNPHDFSHAYDVE
jgi:hypothetical protein